MTVYANLDEVRQALTPDGNPADQSTAAGLSDAALTLAVEQGDAEIDLALVGIYVTPVEPVEGLVPEPIRSWSIALGAWHATLIFMQGKDIGDNDPVKQRRDAVVRYLQSVRTGRIPLNLPRIEEGPEDAVGGATNIWDGDLFDHTDWLPGNVGYPAGPGPLWGPEYSRGGPRQ